MRHTLERLAIERLLPQKGSMCLIDSAREWDADTIVCLADASRPDNPLRDEHGVAVVHGVEYGAQAAAVHHLTVGAVDRTPRGGLLLQLRDVRFGVGYLDRLPQPLEVVARCVMASSETARYRFEIRAAGELACRGELTLQLT